MLVFTSCVNNYIPKARVLAGSLKKWHPDWHFCLLLGESPPPHFDPKEEPFDRVLGFEELGIKDYKFWLFRHRIVEICTAAKGEAMNFFLEREKWDKVIYLDPDIMVLNSLAQLEQLLDQHSILLTPHQLAPQKTAQAILDNEICSLIHGVYNLGFMACASRGQGIEFSRFWRDRLHEYCYDDKEKGLFTDQRWCDLAPAYFSELGIVRDPGCNAASWNLTDRRITREGETFLANGQPLRFYHFTGYDSGMGKIMSSIYGASMPAVKELWDIYEERLRQAAHEDYKKLVWSGNFYSNGKKITDEERYYLRQNPHIQNIFPDPFLTNSSGTEGFAGYWRELKTKRENRIWAIVRKPFRLAALTKRYLAANGGLKAIYPLYIKTRNTLRRGGTKALLAKARAFKNKVGVGANTPTLAKILNPTDALLKQWQKILAKAFSPGVLVIDHQYGGGANDYRNRRMEEFLTEGRPVLLATWDFFNKKLILKAQIPGENRLTLEFEAQNLSDLPRQDLLAFDYILVNDLVLWSVSDPKVRNHHQAIPQILDTIAAIAKKNNSFLEIAVNEYYPVCPNYTLLKNDAVYCELDDSACRECLKNTRYGVPADLDLGQWRTAWQRLFDQANQIRVFSRAAQEILAKKFNIPECRVLIKPHDPLAQFDRCPLPPIDGPMRVGVLGHIATHKGAELVCELARLLGPDESLVVIGELDSSQTPPPNVIAHGTYRREDLPDLFAQYGITVALVPSVWPETFCYTAQECMQLGLPLVVLPLGAQAERAREYSRGKVAAGLSTEETLAALRELDQQRRN